MAVDYGALWDGLNQRLEHGLTTTPEAFAAVCTWLERLEGEK